MKRKSVYALAFAGILTALPYTLALAADLAVNNDSAIPAQNPNQNSAQMTPAVMKNTATLEKIHHINQKEIHVSQIALDNGTSNEVKSFAQKMITEHQSADQQVLDLAHSENIALPNFQPSDAETAKMNSLEKLSGTQFDRAYIDLMKNGHKEALHELQTASKNSTDPKIRSLIQSMIPTVKSHEQLAMVIQGDQKRQMAGEAMEK
jgi:putative membrane protein